MSNYSQTTLFGPKDSLLSGNPAKLIVGAAYDVEFGNIATAIATKPDNLTTSSFLNVNVTGNTIPVNGIYLPATNTLGFASNTTQRATVNSAGAWVINAPTAGTALTVSGVSGANTISANGFVVAQAGNVSIAAPSSGTTLDLNTSTTPLIVLRHTGTANGYITADGSGGFGMFSALDETGSGYYATSISLSLQTNNTSRITVNSAGNVTIAAPSSGIALTATGSGATLALQINAAANGQAAAFDSTNASGAYIALTRSGTNNGFVGSAAQLFTGGVLADFGINAAGGNGMWIGSGSTGVIKVLSTPSIQGLGPVAGALVDMTPDSGTFTITYTGFTAAVTGTAVWTRNGNQVMLFLPVATGTSNATTMTATGLPNAINPTRAQWLAQSANGVGEDNGASVVLAVRINTNNTITFTGNGNVAGAFTASGTKGVQNACVISYMLN